MLVPVNPDLLAWTRDDLVRLRQADTRHGAARIHRDVVRHADHLARMLQTIPQTDRLFRQVARLAAEAAELASHTLWDLGETDMALRWARVVTAAATAADDTDLYALGVEAQATKLSILGRGREVEALALFDHLAGKDRRGRLSPFTRAYIDAWHANTLALRRPATPAAALRLLDRAAATLDTVNDPPPGWAYAFSLGRLELRRGHVLAHLGFAQDALETLEAFLRGCPSGFVRGVGSVHLGLARAAAQLGEADRAVAHAVNAWEVFRATGSVWRLTKVAAVRGQLADEFGSGVVAELDARLHDAAGPRYVLIRSYNRPDHTRPVVHLASCAFVRRSRTARSWPDITGRAPDTLADDPAVRAAAQPCRRCIGPRWA